MICVLWLMPGEFERRVEIGESEVVPELLVVDGVHYIRDGDTLDFLLVKPVRTFFVQQVPIYVSKLFDKPWVFEAKVIRLFSGHHGVCHVQYDREDRISWAQRLIVQYRGLAAFRMNGVWCPTPVRNPAILEQADAADHAVLALAWARAWKSSDNRANMRFRFSAVGLDDYGRLICDISKTVARVFSADEVSVFTPDALATGLFLPARLDV